MTAISTTPPRLMAHEKGDHGLFYCPACEIAHAVYLGPAPSDGSKPIPYNGRPTAPTLVGKLNIPPELQYLSPAFIDFTRCAFTITSGKIAFDPKCGHALAGKTVPIPPWPKGYWPNDKVPEIPINRTKMP